MLSVRCSLDGDERGVRGLGVVGVAAEPSTIATASAAACVKPSSIGVAEPRGASGVPDARRVRASCARAIDQSIERER